MIDGPTSRNLLGFRGPGQSLQAIYTVNRKGELYVIRQHVDAKKCSGSQRVSNCAKEGNIARYEMCSPELSRSMLTPRLVTLSLGFPVWRMFKPWSVADNHRIRESRSTQFLILRIHHWARTSLADFIVVDSSGIQVDCSVDLQIDQADLSS